METEAIKSTALELGQTLSGLQYTLRPTADQDNTTPLIVRTLIPRLWQQATDLEAVLTEATLAALGGLHKTSVSFDGSPYRCYAAALQSLAMKAARNFLFADAEKHPTEALFSPLSATPNVENLVRDWPAIVRSRPANDDCDIEELIINVEKECDRLRGDANDAYTLPIPKSEYAKARKMTTRTLHNHLAEPGKIPHRNNKHTTVEVHKSACPPALWEKYKPA
ncbi:MAG: hypothetical protein ACKVP0_05650 [Pirellulaceae bacterium]